MQFSEAESGKRVTSLKTRGWVQTGSSGCKGDGAKAEGLTELP